ncbi:MAG TPA: o-succinylbenzoate synthase, partial [Acidimicrobiales bacterium]|nr:o-succinylbenzoate synthase [Acidimicrobiales bacterium]
MPSPSSPPVVAAEVREVTMPLRRPFVTGFGATDTRRVVLVHLVDGDGAEGWGEVAPLDHPFYLPDTTSSAYTVVVEWALPMALAAGPDPAAVAAAMAPIRGNTFARAGVEAAFWCLAAARRGACLADLFARSSRLSGRRRPAVPTGESIGIHPSVDATVEEVLRRLQEGYRRVKLKVQPGWDVELVAAVRRAIGPNVALQVDANASYTEADTHRLVALDGYRLACIEQPLAWDDLDAHAALQGRLSTPVCLDESLRSPADVRRALDKRACRSVNLKPGRVGGITASLAIHDMCVDAGVDLWCGGMLESGIGRSFNIALASL